MAKNKGIIKWQKPMTKVTYSLIPIVLASIYFFGWRSLALIAISNIVAFLCEYAFAKYYKNQVTSSIFVTGTLFALTLPPLVPFWIAVIGIAFGVVFGKMVFGGFGKNIFNPAIVGRAFIYVNFTVFMSGDVWYKPISTVIGGVSKYGVDTISGATILVSKGVHSVGILDMIIGNRAGSIGETSAILIILAGLYLIREKIVNWRLIVSCLITFFIFQTAFYIFNVGGAISPLDAFLGGGFLFGLIFMVTEPVSATKTNQGRWIYAGMIGILTVVIRTFSFWPEGMMFAILIGNMFAPLIDFCVDAIKKKGK